MNKSLSLAGALVLTALAIPCISMAQTISIAQLQTEIAILTAELNQLEAQLATASGSTSSWCYTFNANLSIGMSGNAIAELQTALQKDGELVQVTGTFDDQTTAAVTAFQEKYASQILAPNGISSGTGYVGKSTRAELNALVGCSGANPVTSPIVSNPIISPLATSTSPIICPVWGCNGPEPITVASTTASASTPVTVSSPQEGSTYQTGNAMSVTWTPIVGLSEVGIDVVNANGVVVASPNGIGTMGMIAVLTPDNGIYQWQIPSDFPAGTYRISVDGYNGTAYEGFSDYFTISTPVTVCPISGCSGPGPIATSTGSSTAGYSGTLTVSLDPSTPVAGTVVPGQTNVTFADIRLTATGGSAQAQWFSVVSNSTNAVNDLSNIEIYSGPTLLGSAQTLLPFPSTPGGYVNVPVSPALGVIDGESSVLTLVADVSSSASGILNLGIGGGGGFDMSPDYSIYGNNMTVTGISTTSSVSTTLNVVAQGEIDQNTVLAGSTNETIGIYSISNPSTEAVTLNQITYTLGQSSSILNNPGIEIPVGGNQFTAAPSLDVSGGSVSPSVTLNSNGVSIPAGGSIWISLYSDIGASSPVGATESTAIKSCSATGNISHEIYICTPATGQTVTVVQ
jgi:peptidoglycan hydrolase-like protein with peptidoglycan-binding domain